MSIFGGPNRGGGGAPVTDAYGHAVTARGQRPDTAYERAYGSRTPNGLIQNPIMFPGNQQLVFPSITTAPLVQTQTVDQNGKPYTKAVIVPSTQSLIPPPSTLLSSHYASLPNLNMPLVPSNAAFHSFGPTASVAYTPRRSEHLRGSGSIISGADHMDQDFERMK